MWDYIQILRVCVIGKIQNGNKWMIEREREWEVDVDNFM